MEEPKVARTEQAASREDYVKAASIIASCPNDRLPTVLRLLEQAGITFNAPEPKKTKQSADSNTPDENTVNLVFNFIQDNKGRFTGEADGEQYGFLAEDGERVFILTPVLYEELRKAGYSPHKSLRYLAERDAIVIHRYRDGKNCFTVKKYYAGNNRHHFVECRIHILGMGTMEQITLELP